MTTLQFCGWAAVASWAYMTLVWLVSLRLRNASIVDSFWGPGFLVVALLGLALTGAPTWREFLIAGLVATWALRLAAHITIRNRGRGEDWRYRAWREKEPKSFWWRSYPKVFLLQGALLILVATPLLASATVPGPHALTIQDGAGIALWFLGFLFEVVGDEQLRRFKADPAHRGRVCDVGLWKYTRHPNYFGEATLWWGLFLIALSAPAAAWSVVGPIAITFLLLRVSGVRLLEKGLKETKPEYAEYVRRTSPFFPWPPKTT